MRTMMLEVPIEKIEETLKILVEAEPEIVYAVDNNGDTTDVIREITIEGVKIGIEGRPENENTKITLVLQNENYQEQLRDNAEYEQDCAARAAAYRNRG